MTIEDIARRIQDLLRDPRESLDVEIKCWLDLGSGEGKATLAKALLALANHGGGYVLIGFTETANGVEPAPDRPATLDAYSQDAVNGVVRSYADPEFHCAVHLVTSPDDQIHPVIVVPGGHRTPIKAKKGGPGNKTVQANAIYIRLPGPRSETPQSAQDWDQLLARCLSSRRDELLDRVRDLLSGAVGASTDETKPDGFDQWIADCFTRWRNLTDPLDTDDERRCPHGYYWFAYELGGEIRQPTLPDLLELLSRMPSVTGWPTWVVIRRPELAPYVIDGAIECWMGREGREDAAHSDFWRISPEGFAFLLRGYEEDGKDLAQRRNTSAAGQFFDLTLPVWRAGEALLHAGRLASQLSDDPIPIHFRAHYHGLRDRHLTSISGMRRVFDGRISRQDEITLDTVVQSDVISPNLAEVVRPLLEPLYALFDFFQPPPSLADEELSKMRKRQ